MLRRQVAGGFEFRMFSSIELFQFVGYDCSELKFVLEYSAGTRLCGNAFSAFHVSLVWIGFNLAWHATGEPSLSVHCPAKEESLDES